MMYWCRSFCFIFALVALTVGRETNSRQFEKKEDYKKVLSEMFGKDFVPPHLESEQKPRTPPAVAKYMNRLFQRFRNRPDFKKSDNVIVRSLLPRKGIISKSVDFDLSSIRPTENITKARLHVRYRPSKRRSIHANGRDSKFGVYLVRSSINNGVNLQGLRPVGRSYHWLIFNVNAELAGAVPSKKLTLMLGKVGSDGKREFIRSRKTLTRHSPFLVVHSELGKQTREPGTAQIAGTGGWSPDFKSGKPHTGNGTPRNAMFRKRGRRNKRDVLGTEHRRGYFSYSMGGGESETPETKRAEELEDHLRELGPNAVLQSWKDVRNQGRNRNLAKMAKKEPPEKETLATDYVPYSPEHMNPKIVLLGTPIPRQPRKPCGLRSLVVDFADIGWDNWIIAPHKFEANYCDGSCSAKPGDASQHALKQTNHAIIQNIVYNMAHDTRVPQPCCAPESLDSLSLLYYDDQLNIVLRNYPKMTVTACACL